MIVFPMAGVSRRFSEAGYDVPKYMLPIDGVACFDHAVASFLEVFPSEAFRFVMRADHGTPEFVRQRLAALGASDASVVILDGPTAGQAETVELGLRNVTTDDEEGLFIFNIDTFRPDFRPLPREARGDGYLEVFVGAGSNWSFVEDDGSGAGRVARTTEKQPISDLCCTGLYHFGRADDFLNALADERLLPDSGEYYVAPLYNRLIACGRDVRYRIIPRTDVIFCGVPSEYEALASGKTEALARLPLASSRRS